MFNGEMKGIIWGQAISLTSHNMRIQKEKDGIRSTNQYINVWNYSNSCKALNINQALTFFHGHKAPLYHTKTYYFIIK